ncbi:VOC family protein [Streptomyces sp. NPDC048272]|uniref:VOC family protein n=1 Tax=Streptomyces sp. NPDC048272 TaxID=3154616 RepID=UPI003414AF44
MPEPSAHVILAVPDIAATLSAYEQLGFTGTPSLVTEATKGMAAVRHGMTTLFVLQSEDAFRQQNPHHASQPLGATAIVSITGLADFDAVADRVRRHADVRTDYTDYTDDPAYRVIIFRDVNGYLIAISDTPT